MAAQRGTSGTGSPDHKGDQSGTGGRSAVLEEQKGSIGAWRMTQARALFAFAAVPHCAALPGAM